MGTLGPDDPHTEVIEGHTARVNAITFSSDGNRIVTASSDTTLIVWDVDSGAVVHRMEGHGAPVMAVAAVPDSNIVVSASEDYTIRQWDITTGQEITPIAAPVGGQVVCLAVTPDGQTAYHPACARGAGSP